MDLPSWEQEERSVWAKRQAELKILEGLSPEQRASYLADTTYRDAMDRLFSSMIVTTQNSILNIRQIHGIVSAYDYYLNRDLRENMVWVGKTLEEQLINHLKSAAVRMQGNAIIGLVLNKYTSPVSYSDGGTIHIMHCLSVSIYGTAVTLG
ncbi:MAG: hypothetical protein LBT23_06915 [Synergistaceae bacterium]|jgi:hypothetical protein|nr:hypothetical protein [Synergistaceae bacterium]